MKAIVLFDTVFGSTERIAICLTKGIQKTGAQAKCVNIKDMQVDKLVEYDLLAIGAPTQYFTASKSTKEFLGILKGVDLKGKAGFAFDTKLESRFSGSAAKFIEKKLVEYGLEIIKPRMSAIVISQNPKQGATAKGEQKVGAAILKEGMEELFEGLGKELGVLVHNRNQDVES